LHTERFFYVPAQGLLCLLALLSGTPKQVLSLIPDAENGLFSRLIFYYMNILPVWKDVFAGYDSQTLDDYFRAISVISFSIFTKFCNSSPSRCALRYRFKVDSV
jgi:hypothetical protein